MIVIDGNTDSIQSFDNYIALGSFDGLHLGHLSLIQKTKDEADKNNGKSMIYTFKNHPRFLINNESSRKLLMNNEEKVIVYRDGRFIETKSMNLRVGELVVIFDNSTIPCDMVLMDSNLNEGVCYVETSSLDGEKALKQKISNRLTNGVFRSMCSRSL